MKLTAEQKLAIYRPVLARYEAEGDPMAITQRKLISSLEQEIKNRPLTKRKQSRYGAVTRRINR